MMGQMAATNIYQGYFYVHLDEPVLCKIQFDSVKWANVVHNLRTFFANWLADALVTECSSK